VWAFLVVVLYTGIAIYSDWLRFEPDTLDGYWYFLFHRLHLVPDYIVWVGLPLTAMVWIHSRCVVRRRPPAHHGGAEYGVFDQNPWGPQSSVETFVYLYLAAMVIAALGRMAIVQCLMRGECSFFIWYQGLLYSPALLVWPLLLLLLRHAIWWVIRRR
jgi:hypothetical protein